MLDIATPLSVVLNQIPTVSPSRLSQFTDCEMKYHYGYVEGLRKKNQNTFYMDRGTYVHRLMHYYYGLLKSGFRPGSDLVVEAMNTKMRNDMEEAAREIASGAINSDIINILSTSIPHVRNYILNRSTQIDSGIRVIGIEKEYWVLIVLPSGRPVFLHGIIDLVYRTLRNKIRIRDHKTGERADAWSEWKASLDDQLLQYMLSQYLEMNEEIDGAEISFINLAKKPEKRFDLFMADHTPVALKNYQANLEKLLDRMLDDTQIRNYSKDCSNCPFNRLCKLELEGVNTAASISLNYERTNRGIRAAEQNIQGRTAVNPKSEFSLDITLRWDDLNV